MFFSYLTENKMVIKANTKKIEVKCVVMRWVMVMDEDFEVVVCCFCPK